MFAWGTEMLKQPKLKRIFGAAFATGVASLVLSATTANAITYNINFAIGDAYSYDQDTGITTTGSNTTTVTGHIVTDDTLGALSAANFVSWDFTITDSTSSHSLSSSWIGANSSAPSVYGLNLFSASSTEITVVFPTAQWLFQNFDGQISRTVYGSANTLGVDDLNVDNTGVNSYSLIPASTTGGYIFGSVANPSATPLPAGLPLFTTGLGVLGLLGWRRKRRAVAAT